MLGMRTLVRMQAAIARRAYAADQYNQSAEEQIGVRKDGAERSQSPTGCHFTPALFVRAGVKCFKHIQLAQGSLARRERRPSSSV